MYNDPTGVHYGKKVAVVRSRTKTKNLYIIFIAGSSVVATVFACTCILPISYSKGNRTIESRHDMTLIKLDGWEQWLKGQKKQGR